MGAGNFQSRDSLEPENRVLPHPSEHEVVGDEVEDRGDGAGEKGRHEPRDYCKSSVGQIKFTVSETKFGGSHRKSSVGQMEMDQTKVGPIENSLW